MYLMLVRAHYIPTQNGEVYNKPTKLGLQVANPDPPLVSFIKLFLTFLERGNILKFKEYSSLNIHPKFF